MIPLGLKSEHFWKKILSPIYIEVVYTYDASDATDQKHGFLKFWTLNFENGPGWTLGTPWDGSPKKIPAKSSPNLQISFWQVHWRGWTPRIWFGIHWSQRITNPQRSHWLFDLHQSFWKYYLQQLFRWRGKLLMFT